MIKIRPYQDADYESVKRNLEEGKLFDPVWDSRNNLLLKVTRAPDSIMVAEKDGKVVGNIYILADGWSAFIFRLTVATKAQGSGIGTELLNAAEDWVRDQGIEEIAGFVDDSDDALKAWYIKRGYNLTGQYRSMWKRVIPDGAT
ncbi:MAG: GNAT family N-acetyltransferase [Candidatus Kerfeldbacteria bacterium]|nr:GNAT family N-acetyltransferase [Candidatus Kerfeldbacteria bacterium]